MLQINNNEKNRASTQMADNKIIRNSLVLLKRVNKNINNMTGTSNNKFEIEIMTKLPAKSLAQISDIEKSFQDNSILLDAVSMSRIEKLYLC